MSSRQCNYHSMIETKERYKDNLRMVSDGEWDNYYLIKFKPENEKDNGFVVAIPHGSDQKCGC